MRDRHGGVPVVVHDHLSSGEHHGRLFGRPHLFVDVLVHHTSNNARLSVELNGVVVARLVWWS